MKILVTGAAGFIGTHLSERLAKEVEWYKEKVWKNGIKT